MEEVAQRQAPQEGVTMSFHFLIVGGGIGGLCLAQGMKKAGISVGVYERDRTRTDRLQGYRIHIDPSGSRALYDCLPAELFEIFAATCGKPGRGFRILNHRLDELQFIRAGEIEDPAAQVSIARHRSVSRITLRQVLLAGLEDVVHFDKKFLRYEDTGDGRVIAHFEDGTFATGDVLIAADGVNSKVRQQFLPGAEPIDTGTTAIAAKLPLSPEFDCFQGAASILGPQSDGMFVARQEFDKPAPTAFSSIGQNDGASLIHPGMLFDNTQSYLFWAYLARRVNYPVPVREDSDAETLLSVVAKQTAQWNPLVHRMIEQSDPTTAAVWNIRTSVRMEHWKTRNITLLGDAIHSMTPARGIGANIALKDADLLRGKLLAASAGRLSLLQAIEEYEMEMLEYAFEAVEESLRALQQFTGGSPFSRGVTR
jgi:salicylate hydroxylase